MTKRELQQAVGELAARAKGIVAVLDVPTKRARHEELHARLNVPGFWDDPKAAGEVMRELEGLKELCEETRSLDAALADLAAAADEATDEEAAIYATEYEVLADRVERLELTTLLGGPYDAGDAIVTIHAGAGGTDAQDWAEMLLRMYLRWAERHSFGTAMLDESRGTEAGYKSVTFEVRGRYAYGMLHTESGTHRLVRLSPFNADALRQTSFARVEVMPLSDAAVADIVIDPTEIRVDTFRSSGAGGQHVNTTDSAVRITHLATGIVVSCQNERSQGQNKEQALKVLRAKLLQKRLDDQAKERAALRGDNLSAEWGSQIRSYVLHPYKMVKDHRTDYETPQTQDVLDGDLDAFMDAALRWQNAAEARV